MAIKNPRTKPNPHSAELKNAIMLIADISGYTKFVRMKKVSAIHGEQIITELLESITETADFPLKLNKIEGDAVFLWADAGNDINGAVNDVFRQAQDFMSAFASKQIDLGQKGDGGCPCHACSLIGGLGLKIIIHADEIIIKSIAGREELAGEGVILIHRLLKNSVNSKDYIMLSASTLKFLGKNLLPNYEKRVEQIADFGRVNVVFILFDERPKVERKYKPLTRLTGIKHAVHLFYQHWLQRKTCQTKETVSRQHS